MAPFRELINRPVLDILKGLARLLLRFFSSLFDVIQARGFFIFGGFGLGCILVYLSIPIHSWEWLKHNIGDFGVDAVALVVKEIGVGFFVAAIAVFGYEWKSHAKEAVDLIKKLVEIKESEGLDTIKVALKDIFRNSPEAAKLQEHIYKIIEFSNEIAKQEATYKKEYLKVVSWLLDEPIRHNGERLKEWIITENEGLEWDYSMPYTPTQVAGSVLGTQMKILKSTGGYYNSISRLPFWEYDELEYFFDKTVEAVKAGTTVNRVFNLCNDKELDFLIKQGKKEKPNLNKNARTRAKIISRLLKKHLDLRDESGGFYQIRFFLPEHIEEFCEETGADEARVENARYGLFKHYESKFLVRFVAEDENLASIKMGYCREKDPDVALFASMWEKSDAENPFQKFMAANPAAPPDVAEPPGLEQEHIEDQEV